MCAFTFGDAQTVSFSCFADRTAERRRAGRRGSGIVLHLGWSVSHCGKTQYLHFVIRTTFMLLFSTTRICAHLLGEGGSVRPNDLHLFITAGQDETGRYGTGRSGLVVHVWCGQDCDGGLGWFMKVVLLFESCAPDLMAEFVSLW